MIHLLFFRPQAVAQSARGPSPPLPAQLKPYKNRYRILLPPTSFFPS